MPCYSVKQTAGQIILFEAKSAQYLASHKPKVLASLERLNLSNFVLKPFHSSAKS